jgi:hypothetical protein
MILGSAIVTLGFLIALPASAQEAGENVNVLPVVPKSLYPEDWFLRGDGYLQRQVEPTIAASTRNPDHLLAFFNDYRAVDVEYDPFIGEQFQTAALALDTTNLMMAGLLALPQIESFETPPYAATAEAWVGMSRSYDGGLTWSGGFLPGAPFDTSDASLASPVHGLEAATDPVLAPAPCGNFYLVFMAFTRGGQSKLAVARYQDLNNDEGGDTIRYHGTTVLEVGNNAEFGYFLDKPDIEVDVWREPTADECAHRVYWSYSTFNGLDKEGKFQSKINFAYSTDLGQSFTKQKLNPPYNQNQGSALAVDPADGTVYMTWRHFFSPDAILITKSTNYGVKWGKPVMLTVDLPMAAFDQPTISTVFNDSTKLAFRSNGFPTAAVNGEGTVFVAWQERVDGSGIPDPNGSPRIVLMRSDDQGATWKGLGDNDERVPVDNETLDKPYNAGVGGAWQSTSRGPQVQPKLSFGGGRLMLAYYESRGLIGPDLGTDKETVLPADVATVIDKSYITGYDRVMDFRAALLEPYGSADVKAGELIGTSSIQVSRYPIRADADLTDEGGGQDLTDVSFTYEPCDSISPSEFSPPCARQVNRVNLPTSAAGTSPFIGDYPDLVPMVQFVKDGTQWRWATGAADVPYRGFHAIFTDNRHIVPPWDGDDLEYLRYSNYGPPGIDGACTNSGSRNSDVLTSRITADVVVSTPTTYKEIGSASRSFPFSVNNRSPEERYYYLAIAAGPDFGPASFSPVDDSVTEGFVKIFPYSSVSQVLYPTSAASLEDVFQVRVYGAACTVDLATGAPDPNSCTPCDQPEVCLVGTVTFNADRSVEYGLLNLEPDDEEYQNPFVLNPFVLNQTSANSSPSNPFVLNPFVLNPFVLNPFVLNSSPSDEGTLKSDAADPQPAYEIIDTTWVVQPDELNNNTASTQLPVINVDNAEQYVGNYAFQLIVHKSSSHGGYDDACEAYEIQQDQILSNVYQDPFVLNPFVLNPFVLNPFVLNESTENPFVLNPFVLNPFVLNSTFTMAPPDDATTTSELVAKAAQLDDGTVKAPRAPNEVKLTLRAYRLKPICNTQEAAESDEPSNCIDPEYELLYDPRQDPPSAAVGSLTCVQRELAADAEYETIAAQSAAVAEKCFDYFAPDLVPSGVDENIVLTAELGGSVTFPDDSDGGWYLQNQGTAPATAENVELRHGFYLSLDGEVDESDVLLWTETSGLAPVTIDVTLEGEMGGFFDASEIPIPTDEGIEPGDYTLILYVDDLEEVSEIDEINNKVRVKVPITISEPNEPPMATDDTYSTDEDTPLVIFAPGVLANDTDADGDVLTAQWVSGSGPANGALTLNPDGSFTYSPNPNFNGTDSFTYTASDGEYADIATVTITVLPVADYVFDGFLSPWTEDPPYSANAGSAIPLKWRYLDPSTRAVVESSDFHPAIQSTFYEKTDSDCPAYVEGEGETKTITTDPDDPGSSNLRYDASSKEWQINWATPYAPGCYYLRVFVLPGGFGTEVSRPLLIILK